MRQNLRMQTVDTLIVAAHVVPVSPRGVLAGHAVAIDKGRIVAVLPEADALARFDAGHTVRLERHALIPGLVNLHCHVAMTLMRGFADDLPLQDWLSGHIWPAEAKHVNEAFVHDGSLLGMAEMIRGGVTCVNDMYFFPEATARLFEDGRCGDGVESGGRRLEAGPAALPDLVGAPPSRRRRARRARGRAVVPCAGQRPAVHRGPLRLPGG